MKLTNHCELQRASLEWAGLTIICFEVNTPHEQLFYNKCHCLKKTETLATVTKKLNQNCLFPTVSH